MLCVSDMMKSSHVQELEGPSCKLRARSMGTPWAAVDIRWYSEGCYLAPGLDCPVKQFWHGSCPCYYFAYGQDVESLDCRFGGHRLWHRHQGSYGWVPPPPSRLHDCHSPDPSRGETNSRLLHQRSSLPLAPLEARESVGWYFISGEETELQVPKQELEETLKVGLLCSVCFPRQERVARRRKKVDSQS